MKYLLITLLFTYLVSANNKASNQVTVLGYHNFIATDEATAMNMPVAKFQQQMAYLAAKKIPVIDYTTFTQWYQGKVNLPHNAVLITIDDGWKNVYKYAFPILKKYNFPAVIFLYTNYVNCGGMSLSKAAIKELQAANWYIGSHSVSHPLPATLRKKSVQKQTYNKLLRQEFTLSKEKLYQLFRQPIDSYAYPGGFHQPIMYPLLQQAGYRFAFTVNPAKVTRDTFAYTLPRYIILGNNDKAFYQAVNYSPNNTAQLKRPLARIVTPQPGSFVATRKPLITIDLSQIKSFNRNKYTLKIAGFGTVKATISGQKLSWSPPHALRHTRYLCILSWQSSPKQIKKSLQWRFFLNKKACYQQLIKAN